MVLVSLDSWEFLIEKLFHIDKFLFIDAQKKKFRLSNMSECVLGVMFGVLLRNEHTDIFYLYKLYNTKLNIIIKK